MNITELDSYNLADAVKFNDQLNPRIWDRNEHLHPEVRDRLLAIADDFAEFLGIRDLAVKDITISGSNAAYSYTPNSDIDLHLVVDVPDDEVYRELFNAKKFQYNEQHDIKIGGADVELYVQDSKEPHISQGVYSVKNNRWLAVPRRIKSVVDDTSTRNKFETIGHQIERAIRSGNAKRMTRMIDKIKRMRQTGLENHGEFGPENLAYKMLRNQGIIDQLYTARNQARDQELSLAEQEPPQPFVYGFRTVAEASTPDGVSPETKMFLSEEPPVDDEAVLRDFVDFCVAELKIDSLPVIKLRRDPQWPVAHKTFGRYINERDLLEVAWGQRHLMDVLRTVAHELTHRHQHERDGDRMGPEAGETGSEWENEANARAGILMRDYGRLHPELFAAGEAHNLDEGQLDESLRGRAAAAIVAMLLGQPIGAAAQSIQGILGMIRDAGTVAQQARNITRAGLNAEVQQEIVNYVRGVGGDAGSQNLSHLYQLQRQLEQQEQQAPQPQDQTQREPQHESASGYIPTKRQARDPRYSMALTKDIHPGQVGKEANKLNLKTDRQGHPQIARPNGLFEQLMMELEQFQTLDEVKMSPTSLRQFADSPEAKGIRAGFEAELIFPGLGETEDEELEPDMDQDERAYSVQQVIDFFSNDDWGYGMSDRTARQVEEELDDMYLEWRDEQIRRDFQYDSEDLITELWLEDRPMTERIHDALTSGMDLSDDEADAVIRFHDRIKRDEIKGSEMSEAELDMRQQYSQARSIALDVLEEDVQGSIDTQDSIYDQALDNFRDNWSGDDDSFFSDIGLRYMSDIQNNFNLDWPYMTTTGRGGEGGYSVDSANDLARDLRSTLGVKTLTSGGYHSAARDNSHWIFEPDSSLTTDTYDDMPVEIVSPPMPLKECLTKMDEFFAWAKGHDAYANSSTGFHMGVSLPTQFNEDVDYVKLILFLGDQYVLEQFGREGVTYCASAMKKLKNRIGNDRGSAIADALKLMKHNLIELAHRSLADNSGFGKYTSINPKGNYIEFRSAGGADYFDDIDRLKLTMLRYARAMSIAGNPAADRNEYYKKLYKLISPKENDPALALFSRFSAGELNADELKKQWAELALAKERPGPDQEREWEAVDLSGRPLATKKDFSITNATNYFRDVLKLDGFQVREKEPETVSPRAKLAKRIKQTKTQAKDNQQDSEQLQARIDPESAQIPRNWEFYSADSGTVIDQVDGINLIQANAVRADVVRRYRLPDESVRMRSVPTAQSAERARARVQDIEPDVTQNFDQPQATQATVQGVPAWYIYNTRNDAIVRSFFQPTRDAANVYAQQWLRNNGVQDTTGYEVRPAMEVNESVDLERKLNQLLEPTELEQDPKYRREQLRQRQLAWSRKQNLRQVEPESGWPKQPDAIDEAQRWPDIESAKRAFVANPRFQHLPVSTRQAMGASAYLKQQAKSTNLADRLKRPPVKSPHEVDEASNQHIEIIKYRVGDWIVYLDNHSTIRAMTRDIGPRMMSNLLTMVAVIPNLENKVPVGGAFWIQDAKTNSSFYFRRLDVPGEPLAVRCETGVKDVPRAGKQTPVFRVNAYTGPETPNAIKAMKQAKLISRFVGVNTMASNLATNMQKSHSDDPAIIKNPEKQDSKRYDRAFAQAKQLDKKVDENFADGKKPGRKGLAKRMGVNTKASVSRLRSTAKHSSGEKARMAHWLANMKAGRAKAKKK
jgi:Putative amidoligase enzyme